MRIVKRFSISALPIVLVSVCLLVVFTNGDNLTHVTIQTVGSKQLAGYKNRTKKVTTTKSGNSLAAMTAAANLATKGVASTTPAVAGPPSWAKLPLYVDPSNEATQYYESNPTVTGASTIARMGQVPVSEWFGDWDTNIQSSVNTYVTSAAQANAVPVLVLYNIPDRDCGGTSAGGATSASAYVQWAQQVATTIGNRTAVIILEPDALGGADCLSSSDQQVRFGAMSQAVSSLKADPHTFVYIDAGNPSWEPLNVMAQRLQAANINQADGFSLNVSYFDSTAENQAYGDQLSKLVGNKHYVIDTSRNGSGGTYSGTVCNPSNAAFGSLPTVVTGDPLNDALLWIKIPWESDGPCNGGPAPGDVFWSYALQLAQNAGWE